MKKLLYLLLLVCVLAGVAFWLTRAEEKSNDLSEESKFAVENREDVYRILVTERNGEQRDFVKGEDGWFLDDIKVDRRRMNLVLGAVSSAEVKSIAPYSADETLKENFAKHSFKVEVFDRNNDRMKSYYIGSDNNEGTATYYLMEGGQHFYLVGLPYLEGSMKTRFRGAPHTWWNRDLIEYDMKDIKSIKVHYPRQPQSSFIFTQSDGKYRVDPIWDEVPRITRPFVNARAKHFLKEFKIKGMEEYLPYEEWQDSVLRVKPFAELEIVANDTLRLQFIPKSDNNVTGPDSEMFTKAYLFTHFVFNPDTKDFMKTQHAGLKDIFVTYPYFFEW